MIMATWIDMGALGDLASRALPVLVDSAAKGFVLLLIAFVVAALLRRASAASRHLVWVLALSGLLLSKPNLLARRKAIGLSILLRRALHRHPTPGQVRKSRLGRKLWKPGLNRLKRRFKKIR